MEIWKEVKNYELLYEVSNLGNVKSLRFGKEKILKQGLDTKGYKFVSLTKNKSSKSRTVHQLVSESFLNHTPSKHKLVINHKNFIRTDNRLENLDIVTQRENANFKHIKSSSKYTGVCWDKNRNKWMSYIVINNINKFLGRFDLEIEAHNAYQKALNNINILS